MAFRDILMKWTTQTAFYLFWPAVALVTWGELTPRPPHWTALVWDKSLHFTAYFGLAAMATLVLRGGRPLVAALLALAVFGGALELLQGLTGRDPGLLDEVANCTGIVAGYVVAWGYIAVLKDRALVAAKSGD